MLQRKIMKTGLSFTPFAIDTTFLYSKELKLIWGKFSHTVLIADIGVQTREI